jgi:hypothetical protein
VAVANKIKFYSTNKKILENVYLFFSRPFKLLSFIILILLLPLSTHSAVFNVSSGDVGALIDAINTANSNGEADTINLPAGTYSLTDADNFFNGGNGFPTISSEIKIVGSGSATTIIERNSASSFRFFAVLSSGELTLDKLTLRGGRDANSGGGAIQSIGIVTITNSIISDNVTSFFGGGIDNLGSGVINIINSTMRNNITSADGGAIDSTDGEGGSINITNSIFDNNIAGSDGGAIAIFQDDLTISNSVVSLNSAGRRGGGIRIEGRDSVVSITNSTITDNFAGFVGGGIDSFDGTTTINGSTIDNNFADERGGGIIVIFGDITIRNSTISGNSTRGNGGGIDIAISFVNTPVPTANLNNVTIAFNTADTDSNGDGGGGIFNEFGTVNFSNTIISNNFDSTSDPDCFGPLNSLGFNLIETISQNCSIVGSTNNNVTGQDPLLGPLVNNGGTTKTHALLSGSPAINAGNPATPGSGGTSCEVTDQRGVQRNCDIGAFEFVGPAPTPPPPSPSPSPTPTPTPSPSPTPTPTPPTVGSESSASTTGCTVAISSISNRTYATANMLIPLLAAFAIGVRYIRRKLLI